MLTGWVGSSLEPRLEPQILGPETRSPGPYVVHTSTGWAGYTPNPYQYEPFIIRWIGLAPWTGLGRTPPTLDEECVVGQKMGAVHDVLLAR